MENGFNRDGFMIYMEEMFDGLETYFLRTLIGSVIDYGLKNFRISKDDLAYWLSDMIPEITFGEVAMFLDDGSLTAYGQREKREAERKLQNRRGGDEHAADSKR